jgi:uncharacterized cupin superfamily protein
MEEVFLILDGECEFSLDGVSHLLKKDDVIKIAPKINNVTRLLLIKLGFMIFLLS